MRGLRIALRRRFGPLYELARDKTDLNSVADKFRGAFHAEPSHHLVFVGLDGARGKLQDRGNFFHPLCAGMGELFSPAQLYARVCAAALFLGATDAQVPAGATTG